VAAAALGEKADGVMFDAEGFSACVD